MARTHKRSRLWRWLVVVTDQPPMPSHSEVMWGYFTKRRAEREARSTECAYAANLVNDYVLIEVKRA